MHDIPETLSAALADRYEVQRLLGSGGMAHVYLARDLKHNRPVAIKVLKPDLASSIGASRFLREIEIAAGLTHPHIVPLHDSGEVDGMLYYVMPYVEGESLRDRMRRVGRFEISEAVGIAEQVASALEHAHRQGIVHRDIKPENILLVGDRAMVADFGIARAVDAAGGGQLTESGLAIGTPAYMSPEQAGGDPDLDERTDQYSLGCVLFEMLTGRPPYVADTARLMLAKVLTDPVPLLSDSRETAPKSLEIAVARAMAKEPRDRFPSWRDFVVAIDAHRVNSAESETLAGRTSRGAPIWLAGIAVVFIGLWILLIAMPSGSETVAPEQARRIAVLPFTFRGTEVSYLGEGMVDLLSTKLDGAGQWLSVDPRAVLASLPDDAAGVPGPSQAANVAEQLGADLFVLGAVIEIESSIRIDASLYDRRAGSMPVAQATAEGDATEVLSLVDNVASQLLVGDSPVGDARLTRLAAMTTQSLPALKAYLRGSRAMRTGDFPAAGEALREAVTEDTAFALAWYQLSVAADWLLRADIATEAAEQAVKFSDRLSERDRRLLEALRTVRQGSSVESERLYRAIVGTFPDDTDAWFQLGELQFHFGPRLGKPVAASEEAWRRLNALDPDDPTVYPHLARIAAAQGDVQALDSIARLVAGMQEDSRVPLEVRMLQAFSNGSSEARNAIVDDVRREPEVNIAEIAWSAASFLDDVAAVRDLVAIMTEESRSLEARALGHVWLAHIALAEGRKALALDHLGRAEQLDSVPAIEYEALLASLPDPIALGVDTGVVRRRVVALAGEPPSIGSARSVWFRVHEGIHAAIRAYLLGLLQSGDAARAEEHARTLENMRLPVEVGSMATDLAIGVRANAALAAGRAEQAHATLRDLRLHNWHQLNVASPFFSAGHQRFLRAQVAAQLGFDDEALQWYSTFAHTSLWDVIYRAPADFNRGRIHESRGDAAHAIEYYSRFVERWDSADAELQALVTDARDRIERLRAQRPR